MRGVKLFLLSFGALCFACDGPLMNKIVNGLKEIDSWETLASQLGFTLGEISSIEQNCVRSVQVATCYNRDLLRRLCETEESQDDAFKRLIRALKELEYNNLAKRFEKLLLPQPGTTSTTTDESTKPPDTTADKPAGTMYTTDKPHVNTGNSTEYYAVAGIGITLVLASVMVVVCAFWHRNPKRDPKPHKKKHSDDTARVDAAEGAQAPRPQRNGSSKFHPRNTLRSVVGNTVNKGIHSPEYKCVQQNYGRLTKHLQMNKNAKNELFQKFVIYGWHGHGECLTESELINIAMERIKGKATEYDMFVSMLEDIVGTDTIVENLKDAYSTLSAEGGNRDEPVSADDSSATAAKTTLNADRFSRPQASENSVSTEPLLGINDLKDVQTALVDVNKWFDLGLALGLRQPTLQEIQDQNRPSAHKREMLTRWLNQVDECCPNWKALVEALESPFVQANSVANEIKKAHNLA